MNVEEAGGEGEADPQLGARVEAHHHPHREYTIIIIDFSYSVSPDGLKVDSNENEVGQKGGYGISLRL